MNGVTSSRRSARGEGRFALALTDIFSKMTVYHMLLNEKCNNRQLKIHGKW